MRILDAGRGRPFLAPPSLFVLLAISVAWSGCGGDNGDRPTGRGGEVPDEVVVDFTTEESDSGLVQWKLTAPRANRFNSRSVFVMDRPKIEFYDDFGNLQTTLTSDAGEYDQNTRDLLAYGHVVVVSASGSVLETDSLRYLNELDKITSDSAVKLTRGNDILTGVGLVCDHNLSSVDIESNVKAMIVDDEKQFEN